MTSPPTIAAPTDAFVRAVTRACRDKGRRAALRRCLGQPPERSTSMHAVVAPLLPMPLRADQEHAYYTIAAIVAAGYRRDDGPTMPDTTDSLLPHESDDMGTPLPRSTLGRAMADAVISPRRRGMARDSAEKRLHLAVRQDHLAIHRYVASLMRHLITAEVPVDQGQLLHDLLDWRYRRDSIAKRWLQDYYRTLDAGTTMDKEDD